MTKSNELIVGLVPHASNRRDGIHVGKICRISIVVLIEKIELFHFFTERRFAQTRREAVFLKFERNTSRLRGHDHEMTVYCARERALKPKYWKGLN